MSINVNDTLHGFRFLKKTDLPDISAVMHEGVHEKSGAKLLFIEREDVNKTFAISFTTVPEDDTGVFHILEHSVLCGSKKYPVKEPFVELLKSSLNTFLNAMTYNDKTVYPVCSKNDRDFYNLVSVYMDAVLHPAMLENENIFRQEGWHYEVSDEGNLTYNGVVYNEMKGSYSSVDDLANEKLMQMLYPDSCYSKDSGGNPDFIPELTYEGFVAAHKRFYHPSNSKIILDGNVNLEEILSLVDSFLSEYDAIDPGVVISDQAVMKSSESRAEYEIEENENEEGKARMILGHLGFGFDEIENNIILSLIREYLTGSNESPLKKALLDSGLCEDASIYELDGIIRTSSVIDIRNIHEENKEKIRAVIKEVIERELAEGLKRDRLNASLNALEFRMREADWGGYPRGLMYSLSTLDTWLYGGDPAAGFRFSEILASLREALNTDLPERILREIFLEGEVQTLLMIPSKTLAKRRAEEEKRALAQIKEKMTESELEEVRGAAAALVEWQGSENSAEALATLPKLTLDDISTEPEMIPTEITEIDGTKVLFHPIGTSGIIYSTLVFDVSDLTARELFTLSFASTVMLNARTENYDALSLQEKIKSSLGLLSPKVMQYRKADGSPIPAFVVNANALAKNKSDLIDLVKEVIYTTDFSDKQVIKKLISQAKIAAEESFISAGHAAAMARADAHVSASGAVDEYISGYEAYRIIKEYEKDFDNIIDSFSEEMKALTERVLVKGRLTVSVASPRDGELLSELVGAVKCGEYQPTECLVKPLPKSNDALVIPSRVAYAAISAHLGNVGKTYDGSSQVVRAILNYEHLWNSVRVRGGAYGAGIIYRSTGRVSFYSYRDPKPARTFEEFAKSGDFLREYAKRESDLTSLIIGAVGGISPLLTPKLSTALALSRYFASADYAVEKRILEELVSTTADDLVRLADTLDLLCADGARALVGSREHVDGCSHIIDNILEL